MKVVMFDCSCGKERASDPKGTRRRRASALIRTYARMAAVATIDYPRATDYPHSGLAGIAKCPCIW